MGPSGGVRRLRKAFPVNDLVKMGLARGGSILFVCATGFSQGACGGTLYAEAEPAPAAGPPGVYTAPAADQDIAYVDSAPPDVESYPSFYIDGGYAYYVDGRWYRRGPRGWGYYRREPPQLERQRAVIQQAPPAQRERARVEQAPRAEPPRQVEERGREQARPEERERARVEQAPPAGRPGPGVVEAQPASHGAAPHAAPPKKPAPPQKHEDQHDHDHH
jgi:hypothetical protein